MGRFATCDDVAASLRALRTEAGQPSFAHIAASIGAQRILDGVAPEVAKPGRTTVYDAFRDGRQRIDAKLVGEIVRALGVDEDAVRQWEADCRSIGQPADELPAVRDTHARLVQIPPFPSRRRVVAAMVLGFVLVNLLGRGLVVALDIPLHLDMIGTAIGAFVLGPWWGALIGLLSNGAGVVFSGWTSIPFALVNIAGALVWGYGIRGRWGETLARFFVLSVATALACSIVAAPIVMVVFGGEFGRGADSTGERIMAVTHSFFLSVFSANLLISLADKLISSFLALVATEAIATRRRA